MALPASGGGAATQADSPKVTTTTIARRILPSPSPPATRHPPLARRHSALPATTRQPGGPDMACPDPAARPGRAFGISRPEKAQWGRTLTSLQHCIGRPPCQSAWPPHRRQTLTQISKTGTFSLGDRTVKRLGYGAMQLAGKGVFGPPRSCRRPRCAARSGGERV